MSMKENISYIKEEIGQEERMLEGMIRLEGWFRKYKRAVFALLAAILVFWIGAAGYDYYRESRAQKAYAIYEQLLQNPDNAELLEKLKQSGSGLYELFIFQEASQKGDEAALAMLLDSQNEIIASLAQYQLASLHKNPEELAQYTQKDRPLFGDLARISRAYLLMNEGRIAEAKEVLAIIPDTSSIKTIAGFLGHFGLQDSAK